MLDLPHRLQVSRDDRLVGLAHVVELLDGVEAKPDHQRNNDRKAEKDAVGNRDRHVKLRNRGSGKVGAKKAVDVEKR